MRITHPQDMPRLLDEMHDRYINVDGVTLDRDQRRLTLPRVGEKRKGILGTGPDPDTSEGPIDVHHVVRYEVDDQAQIGFNSVNTIVYDDDESLITITCNETCVIRVWVEQLAIHLVPERGAGP